MAALVVALQVRGEQMVHETALTVATSLRHSGLPHKALLTNAEVRWESLCVELGLTPRDAPGRAPSKFGWSYITALGHSAGLGDGNGNPLLDLELCARLGNSVVVLYALTPSGQSFRNGLRSCVDQTGAFVTFNSYLHVPRLTGWRSMADLVVNNFRGAFKDALLEPLRSLMRGASVKQAVDSARRLWHVAVRSRTLDPRLRQVVQRNRDELKWIGYQAATVRNSDRINL